MSVTGLLARLYPAPVRDRWGPIAEDEAARAGWRSWPNLAAGLVDLWLHPAIWPSRTRAQRHHRAAALTVVLAVAGTYVAQLTAELSARRPDSAAMGACAVLMVVGLALVAPIPRPTRRAAARLLRQAVLRLAVPATLAAAVVVTVDAGVYTDASAATRIAVLACWWLALALGGIQICRLVAALDADVVAPPTRARLGLGLAVLAAETALAGAVIIGVSLTGGPVHPAPVVAGAALLALTPVFLATLCDLRRLPAVD